MRRVAGKQLDVAMSGADRVLERELIDEAMIDFDQQLAQDRRVEELAAAHPDSSASSERHASAEHPKASASLAHLLPLAFAIAAFGIWQAQAANWDRGCWRSCWVPRSSAI